MGELMMLLHDVWRTWSHSWRSPHIIHIILWLNHLLLILLLIVVVLLVWSRLCGRNIHHYRILILMRYLSSLHLVFVLGNLRVIIFLLLKLGLIRITIVLILNLSNWLGQIWRFIYKIGLLGSLSLLVLISELVLTVRLRLPLNSFMRTLLLPFTRFVLKVVWILQVVRGRHINLLTSLFLIFWYLL